MRRNELKSTIIAIIAMIGLIGALCIATPAMAEGNMTLTHSIMAQTSNLPEVPDQVMSNTSKDTQDFGVIEIDPDPDVHNESLNNSSADLRTSGSVYSGEIVGVTITPDRLVSGQPATFSVSVENVGSTNTCYQLEYYSNGVHMTSGFERWIEPGDTETFSWQVTMGSTGDRRYTFDLYWDQVWYAGDNVLLDTAIVDRYCYAAGIPDMYEPDDDSSYATVIDTNGEAQYHDFHDSGDGDWVKFYMESGEVYTVETTTIGDRADTYLTFCYYDGTIWHYIYNDDGGVGRGSKITYTCTRSGYHYAKARQYSSDVYGETTAYSISVSMARTHSPFEVGGHVYLCTATVSGADVTVTNLNTSESLTTTTDSNGVYVVNLGNLPSGHRSGDIIQVTATYNGQTGTNSAPRSESLSDAPQIIDVTISQAVQIKAGDGGSLPGSIPVGETFTVLITENGSPVGAGTIVQFTLPYDTPITVSTGDDGKVRYMPLITGTLGIRVLDADLVTVAEATVEVTAPVAPTLVTYTITNTMITPPQTTSIDVSFSEQVSAIIKIDDASGNLVNELYNSIGVTDPSPKTWDGTYTNSTTVPNGTYTVNVSGVNTTTGLSMIDTSKTITVVRAHHGGGSALVSIYPISSVAGAGDSFSVDVLVDPAGETLAGGTVELSFNSDVLSITSHSKGTIFSCESSDMGSDWATAGYAKINLAALGCTATTAGTWANITFEVADDASDGVYDIEITSAVLKDPTTAVLPGTTMTNGTVTIGTPTLDGDINGNSKVDLDDLILLGAAWGTSTGETGYSAATDINSNGVIDIDDLILLGANWTE